MRLPSGEMEGYASDSSPLESWTRFWATCGPLARWAMRVTRPPTEQRARASRTAGRRKNLPDAISSSKEFQAPLPCGRGSDVKHRFVTAAARIVQLASDV